MSTVAWHCTKDHVTEPCGQCVACKADRGCRCPIDHDPNWTCPSPADYARPLTIEDYQLWYDEWKQEMLGAMGDVPCGW